MKKPKEIPVYLEGKFIEMTQEVDMLPHKLYKKWGKMWKVKKIHHDWGKRVNMENVYRRPYVIS